MSNKALETLVDWGLLRAQYRTEYKAKDPGQINDLNKLVKNNPEILAVSHEMANMILAAQTNVNKTATVYNSANVELFPNLIPDDTEQVQQPQSSLAEKPQPRDVTSVGSSATNGFLEDAPATPPPYLEQERAPEVSAPNVDRLRQQAWDAAKADDPYDNDSPWVGEDAA